MQLDTCKIAPACYQYTTVDDCMRYRGLAMFHRHTAAGTLAFLERVLEEMPFPVQRVQTDRGREFFAVSAQQWLMDHSIKFRPIKPPHRTCMAKWSAPRKPIEKHSGGSLT